MASTVSVSFSEKANDIGAYAWTKDCSLILIDCDETEKAYADNMYERSQLNYLLNTDPKGYAELDLGREPESLPENCHRVLFTVIPAVRQHTLLHGTSSSDVVLFDGSSDIAHNVGNAAHSVCIGCS